MSKYPKNDKPEVEIEIPADTPYLPDGVQTGISADNTVTDNDLGGGENELVIGDASKAPETITLHNKLRYAETVRSVTGDSILVPPGKHPVPGHFNWNLPDGISIVKE